MKFCFHIGKEEASSSVANKPSIKDEVNENSEVNYFTMNNYTQDSAQFSDDDEELSRVKSPTGNELTAKSESVVWYFH